MPMAQAAGLRIGSGSIPAGGTHGDVSRHVRVRHLCPSCRCCAPVRLTARRAEHILSLFSGDRASSPERGLPMTHRRSLLVILVSALGAILAMPASAFAVDTAPVPIPGGFVPFPG